MATKNELGFKVDVKAPVPDDVKHVKAVVTVGDVTYLDETFAVPGESGEFWVEQGSEISVATQTIDDAGNVQVEPPKVFTFTAVDLFHPAPLDLAGLAAVGERTVEVPDAPTDPPVDPPTE